MIIEEASTLTKHKFKVIRQNPNEQHFIHLLRWEIFTRPWKNLQQVEERSSKSPINLKVNKKSGRCGVVYPDYYNNMMDAHFVDDERP